MLPDEVRKADGVRQIPESELIRRVIASLKPTRNFPLWVKVMDTFALGSTYATELCRIHGFNPDAMKRETMTITAHLSENSRG